MWVCSFFSFLYTLPGKKHLVDTDPDKLKRTVSFGLKWDVCSRDLHTLMRREALCWLLPVVLYYLIDSARRNATTAPTSHHPSLFINSLAKCSSVLCHCHLFLYYCSCFSVQYHHCLMCYSLSFTSTSHIYSCHIYFTTVLYSVSVVICLFSSFLL